MIRTVYDWISISTGPITHLPGAIIRHESLKLVDAVPDDNNVADVWESLDEDTNQHEFTYWVTKKYADLNDYDYCGRSETFESARAQAERIVKAAGFRIVSRKVLVMK